MRSWGGLLVVLALGLSWTGAVADEDKSGVKPQVLSLPTGPGSIEGLGESFEPQLNTGTASHSIALEVPPGRAGFAPDLSLAYNSGNGAGMAGLGWSLSLPYLHISRHRLFEAILEPLQRE